VGLAVLSVHKGEPFEAPFLSLIFFVDFCLRRARPTAPRERAGYASRGIRIARDMDRPGCGHSLLGPGRTINLVALAAMGTSGDLR